MTVDEFPDSDFTRSTWSWSSNDVRFTVTRHVRTIYSNTTSKVWFVGKEWGESVSSCNRINDAYIRSRLTTNVCADNDATGWNHNEVCHGIVRFVRVPCSGTDTSSICYCSTTISHCYQNGNCQCLLIIFQHRANRPDAGIFVIGATTCI